MTIFIFKLTYGLANIRQILHYGAYKVNIVNFPTAFFAYYVGYIHTGYID